MVDANKVLWFDFYQLLLVLEPLAAISVLPKGAAFAEGRNFGPRDEDCRPVSYIVNELSASWGNGASWLLTDKPQPHDAAYLKVDAPKARTRLGWNSRLWLDDALAWTAKWYRAQLDGKAAAALAAVQIERYEALGTPSH
jgi:CDP-glucose 4,6-dehydratase